MYMQWEFIGVTIIFFILGYLIGSISNAIIISKIWKKEDIRDKDSGNAGATNILRNYGLKFGLIVFILDIAKVVLAIIIAWSIKKYLNVGGAIVSIAGLAAIIGHIFPIYFKFKGGKGSASFIGFAICIQWPLFFIGLVVVFSIAIIWKQISLASIIAPGIVLVFQISFHFIPIMNNVYLNPLMNDTIWWVNSLLLGIAWILIIITHRGNIKRILNGTERKIGSTK